MQPLRKCHWPVLGTLSGQSVHDFGYEDGIDKAHNFGISSVSSSLLLPRPPVKMFDEAFARVSVHLALIDDSSDGVDHEFLRIAALTSFVGCLRLLSQRQERPQVVFLLAVGATSRRHDRPHRRPFSTSADAARTSTPTTLTRLRLGLVLAQDKVLGPGIDYVLVGLATDGPSLLRLVEPDERPIGPVEVGGALEPGELDAVSRFHL